MTATAAVQPAYQAYYSSLVGYLGSQDAENVRQAIERTSTGWAGFVALMDNDARNVQRFSATVRVLKMSGWQTLPNNLVQLLQALYGPRNPRAAVTLMEHVAREGTKTRAVMRTMASFGRVIGFVTLAMNVSSHASRGTWGPVAAEVFKFAIGFRLPYLAIVDALEQLVSAYWPGAAGHVGWSYLRSLNVLGVAAVGVDTVATLAQYLVEGAVARRFDPAKFEAMARALDARIRTSPASAFSRVGDNLAGAFDQMSRMTPQQILGDLGRGAIDLLLNGPR